MAQQIKKKFIKSDAVDGDKLKLLKDQAVRGQKQDGSEVELLKLDGSDKLVSGGKEIAFKEVVDAQVLDLQNKLDSEEAFRISGDETIQANLDAEVARALAAEGILEQGLNNEGSARILGDQNLQGQVNSISTDIADLEQQVSDSIAQEQMDRDAAILAEKTRAMGEESRIESKFDSMMASEEAARISGDASTLAESKSYTDGKIDLVMSNLDTEALDSLVEVVSAFQAADSNINNTISTLAQTASSALAQEKSEREAADFELQSDIDAEVIRATGEESRIESKFDGMMSVEQAARIAGDLDLESKINTEKSRAMGVESQLQSDLLAEVSARESAISSEQSARISGDADLQSKIDIEKSRAMGVESQLQSDLSAEVSARQSAVSAEASARSSADSNLQSQITAEVSAREAADIALQTSVSTEQAARIAGDADLQAQLDDLDGYAQDIRGDLDQEILDRAAAVSAEASARQSADSALQSSLNSEISSRQAGDSALQSSLNSEISARQTADSTEQAARIAGDAALSSSLATEEAARIAGDQSLQTAVNTEKARIDAILLASEADKDSFAEIVQLINSVDTENDQAFASYVLSNNAALASEESARIAGDQALTTSLQQEVIRATAEETRIESKFDGLVSAEQSARELADQGLQLAINDEQSARISAISSEVSSREAADANLQSQIDALSMGSSEALEAEIARAQAAEQALEDSKVNRSGDTVSGVLTFKDSSITEDRSIMVDSIYGIKYHDAFTAADSYVSDLNLDASRLNLVQNFTADFVGVTTTNLYAGTMNMETSISTNGTFSSSIFGAGYSEVHFENESGVSNTIESNAEMGMLSVYSMDEYGTESPIMPQNPENVTVKAYVDQQDQLLSDRISALEVQTDGPYFNKMKFVIDESSELSSIQLDHECMENSLVVCVGRLMVHKDEDYSVSVVDGKSVLTWMGDFASGGVEAIEEGDVIFVTYAREV